MKRLLILAAIVGLAACTPGSSVPQGFNAVLPAELKDCTIHRLTDGVQVLYITRCPETTTTSNLSKGGSQSAVNNSIVDKTAEHNARVDALLLQIDAEIARLEAKKKELK